METQQGIAAEAARIIAAFVSNNPVSPAELSGLIQKTVAALACPDQVAVQMPAEPQKPAVSIKKSVAEDRLTCLEDGKTFQSIKRHLRVDHNLSPAEYRAKWGLPKEYPMVAPAYSERRSILARQIAFGRKPEDRLAANTNAPETV